MEHLCGLDAGSGVPGSQVLLTLTTIQLFGILSLVSAVKFWQEVAEVNKVCSFLVVHIALPLAFPFLLHADSPPENTIPVISWAHGYEDIDTELYCRLSWWFFDGLAVEYFYADSILEHVVLPADTTGMYTVINPWDITCMTHRYSHMFPMNSTKAFAWPVWKGYTIDDTTYTQDALRDSMTAVVCRDSMGLCPHFSVKF